MLGKSIFCIKKPLILTYFLYNFQSGINNVSGAIQVPLFSENIIATAIFTMNVFQLQESPCFLDILVTVSKVPSVGAMLKRLIFSLKIISRSTEFPLEVCGGVFACLFVCSFSMCESISSKQVYGWQVLHKAALFSLLNRLWL